MFAAVVGSSPTLSRLTNQPKENWFIGALVAGLISTALPIVLPLVFVKGLMLMSIVVIMLSLAACGELV
jgi:uncharacterized membrane protein